MGKREAVTAATIAAVARQYAGHPLEEARAEGYAAALEPLLEQIAALRRLPLKEIEPATVFQPIETPPRGSGEGRR